MFTLLYTSDAASGIENDTLADIFSASMKFNAQNDITGILLFRDNKFMQLLEGSKNNVTRLYDKIINDPRHDNCSIINKMDISERNVGYWSTGCLQSESKGLDYEYISFVMRLANSKFNNESSILHEKLLDFARIA